MDRTIYMMHKYDDSHLMRVIEEMEQMGAPEIRIVDCGDHWFALEGVHRIEAAKRLGIEPVWIEIQQDDLVPSNTLDWDDLQKNHDYKGSELVEFAFSPTETQIYEF